MFKCICKSEIFTPIVSAVLPEAGSLLTVQGAGVKCATCERVYDVSGVLIHSGRALEARMFSGGDENHENDAVVLSPQGKPDESPRG